MKLAVICNPAKVSDEESLRVEIKRRWPDAGLKWLQTTVDNSGEGQARQALDRGAGLVLVAGGDGTVAECAGPLASTGVLMASVPMGTGNLLARNLGLPLDRTDENTKDRISWLAYVFGGARALRRTKSTRYEVSVDNGSTVSARASSSTATTQARPES